LNPELSTATYPSLTPTEALLTVVGDVEVTGYKSKRIPERMQEA
jgi:hypothetical protein